MNISDEAVEAVLKVLSEHVDASECCARAALEAAAPHLMAQAWGEGYEVGVKEEQPYWTLNPYRSAGGRGMNEDKSMSITEFLEARIAEDEMTAKALLRDLEGQIAEEYAGAVDEKGPMTPTRLLSAQMWAHYDGQSKRRSFAKGQQIATLASPERVLAECEAKWKIIANSDPSSVRILADVYKDHPDYDPTWSSLGAGE